MFEFKLSDLTDLKKQHLVWRLDAKTGCGLLTAIAVANGKHGDLSLIDIFKTYGNLSERSAKIHAGKVIRFRLEVQSESD